MTKCAARSESGLPCQKRLYDARNGETWEHAGGHMFASDEVWANLDTRHYDATALLSGLPASSHEPADCPGWPFCFR